MAGLTWEEYGRAIVEGLADLKLEMRDAKVESNRVAGQLLVLTERSESVAAFEKRLSAVEQQVEAAEERVNTYRRSLLAVGLTLLGTILLPIIRAYSTTKGAGP